MISLFILGISCFYHDSAACLLKDGKIVAAAEEERFTRKKHDNNFPLNAIKYCLKEGKISVRDIDIIGFYEKPLIKFERILQTAVETYPFSFMYFFKAIPTWLNEKLRIRYILKKKLNYNGKVLFIDHHMSHASSAFFVSPFKKAAILTVDGVGEWKTTSLYTGENNKITPIKEIQFPHSLGLFYSAITAYLGFQVNNDEYKVMALASYGKPKYYKRFKKMITIKDDGSFKLNLDYFSYRNKSRMWSNKLEKMLGKSRKPNTKLSQRHMDIASTLQKITEEALIKMANHLYETTKIENLCMAGGVALNTVANGKLHRETPFKRIFIQPSATDAGGALGVANYIYYQIMNNKRNFNMSHAFFGPNFSENEIKRFLVLNKIEYKKYSKKELVKKVAELLSKDKIIGWFQGRMELGPRALGNRSILANPKNPRMRNIINEKVKHREWFRPFAGSVLIESVDKYFDVPYKNFESPFMLFVFDANKNKKNFIPSIVHVDGSCRIQTVTKTNKLFYDLIKEFENLTKIPIILNTSFNIRGEPIVCTPQEAYEDFKKTYMDYLVMDKFLIKK